MKKHVAIMMCDGNNILFIKRSSKKSTIPNIWSFPSGTIEEGEMPHEAAIREAKEELNLNVENNNHICSYKLDEFGVELLFFLCQANNYQNIIFDTNEISEFKWMSFDEFFEIFSDDEIGHGLRWLRKNPNIIDDIINNSK